LFKVGALYSYSFLWSHEKSAGEISGRMDRPCCLLVRSEEIPEVLFLFPVTSREPRDNPFADRVPAAECKRANLREPARVILDETNIALASSPFDFISLAPVGEFSRAYRQRLIGIAQSAIAARLMKAVKR